MDTKEEIIVRSEQLFMRVGVKSVTMDDISRELGMSKKTLYQHFENKDSLIEAVINTHCDREKTFTELIAREAKDALDEVKNIGSFLASTIEDVSPSTLFDLQKYYNKSWETLMRKQDEHIINSIVRNIEKGISEGNYRSDVNSGVIARIYAKATYMIVEEIANPNSKFSRKEMIWELHNYHIHAIATPKGLKLWKQYTNDEKY
jgi:TetR/AcrR family transcriptional regulator, cholesterol catabolism regulator